MAVPDKGEEGIVFEEKVRKRTGKGNERFRSEVGSYRTEHETDGSGPGRITWQSEGSVH